MSKNCNEYPLLNTCFFIQSSNLNALTLISCDNNPCSSPNNGSIVAVLNFVDVDLFTKNYLINYIIFCSAGDQPIYIPGTALRASDGSYQCVFNDFSVMNIRFSSNENDLGKVNIVSTNLSGLFTIINRSTYLDFYKSIPCVPNLI
jgi:hypothetical protein